MKIRSDSSEPKYLILPTKIIARIGSQIIRDDLEVDYSKFIEAVQKQIVDMKIGEIRTITLPKNWRRGKGAYSKKLKRIE